MDSGVGNKVGSDLVTVVVKKLYVYQFVLLVSISNKALVCIDTPIQSEVTPPLNVIPLFSSVLIIKEIVDLLVLIFPSSSLLMVERDTHDTSARCFWLQSSNDLAAFSCLLNITGCIITPMRYNESCGALCLTYLVGFPVYVEAYTGNK